VHAITPKHSGTEVMSNSVHTIQYNFAVLLRILVPKDLFVLLAEMILGEGRICIYWA
jgi:hypothetical protein